MPVLRYPEDPTGINPANRVVNETHVLAPVARRPLVPVYGPFFAENLNVVDTLNNRVLRLNTDYVLAELLQEATSKFGKAIYQLILVINSQVSSQIRVDYQTLGGNFVHNAQAIKNLYEALMQDTRAVDWSAVMNKPASYPPGLHLHLMEDLWGSEAIVSGLERIRQAMVLADVPAYEALIDWVRTRGLTMDDVDAGVGSDKFVRYDTLLAMMKDFNFNAITVAGNFDRIEPGQSLQVELRTTNLPSPTTLYWTLKHYGTVPSDFNQTTGSVVIRNDRGSFLISTKSSPYNRANDVFVVELRRKSPTGTVIKNIGPVSLGALTLDPALVQKTIDLFTACCLSHRKRVKRVTAKALYIVNEKQA